VHVCSLLRAHVSNSEFQFTIYVHLNIQGVPGGKISILRGHSIGHSKQKCLYEHVSYSERFPR